MQEIATEKSKIAQNSQFSLLQACRFGSYTSSAILGIVCVRYMGWGWPIGCGGGGGVKVKVHSDYSLFLSMLTLFVVQDLFHLVP